MLRKPRPRVSRTDGGTRVPAERTHEGNLAKRVWESGPVTCS
jgi:hypothetical protein